jgi:hypothetical protein
MQQTVRVVHTTSPLAEEVLMAPTTSDPMDAQQASP